MRVTVSEWDVGSVLVNESHETIVIDESGTKKKDKDGPEAGWVVKKIYIYININLDICTKKWDLEASGKAEMIVSSLVTYLEIPPRKTTKMGPLIF